MMKTKKTAVLGFLIGVILASGVYSLATVYIDNKVGYLNYSMYFMENYTKILSLLQDYENGLVTAEYTGVLIERQAKTFEQMHDVAILNYSTKTEQIAENALNEVLNSLEILHAEIINEGKLMRLEESIVPLNGAVKSYLESME